MLIYSAGQSLNAPEVTPAMMQPGNYYLIEIPGYDDASGEETTARDMVWFSLATVPGQAKKVKTCRFCSAPKELTFSQVPGAKFYGPVTFQMDASGDDQLRTIAEEERHTGLGAILAKAAKATATKGN